MPRLVLARRRVVAGISFELQGAWPSARGGESRKGRFGLSLETESTDGSEEVMEAKPGLLLMSGSLVEAVSLLEWSSWVRGWKGLDAEQVLWECFMAARKVGQKKNEVVGKRSSLMCRANFVSLVGSKIEWEAINLQLGGSCHKQQRGLGKAMLHQWDPRGTLSVGWKDTWNSGSYL